MLDVIQSVVALIVTLSILVTIHEFGHYWVAKLCGVHVLRFSVGFGKPFYIKHGKQPVVQPPAHQVIETRSNETLAPTEFALAAIPLGGYVKMLDERDGFVADDRLHLAFNRKPVLQRIAITAAGPIANFLLAIVAYWVLFIAGVSGVAPILGELDKQSVSAQAGLSQGQEIVAVDGEPTNTWSDVNMQLFGRIGDTGDIAISIKEFGSNDVTRQYQLPVQRWLSDQENPYPAAALGLVLNYPEIPAVIGGVVADSAAKKAGLQANDKILRFNGEAIVDWLQFVKLIQSHANQTVQLDVLRANTELSVAVTPGSIDREGQQVGFLGASRQAIEMPEEMLRHVSYPFYSAWIPAVDKTWSVTMFTLESIYKMLKGAISPKNLSGPITIAQVASDSAESGLENFISFLALLSISLGVINLLPIPILDGGHLVYYLIELATRRPVPERIQMMGLQMGMFLLVGIMMLAFYNDLMRL